MWWVTIHLSFNFLLWFPCSPNCEQKPGPTHPPRRQSVSFSQNRRKISDKITSIYAKGKALSLFPDVNFNFGYFQTMRGGTPGIDVPPFRLLAKHFRQKQLYGTEQHNVDSEKDNKSIPLRIPQLYQTSLSTTILSFYKNNIFFIRYFTTIDSLTI